MAQRARRHRASTVRNRALVGLRYKPQFGVIVVCRDESHQRSIYEQLNRRGLKCRVVVA